MKLLILGVDGYDPYYAVTNQYNKFRHMRPLSIPDECMIQTPEGPEPSTGLVWSSMFAGRIISHALIERKGLRKLGHDFLLRNGIRFDRQRASYTVGPWNEDLETVFSEKSALIWNVPTLCPEWIVRFPDEERMVRFSRREYQFFKILARGMIENDDFELGCVYTRYLDVLGHLMKTPDQNMIYSDISHFAWRLAEIQRAQGNHLILVSDHGCFMGRHTHSAYIGATFPFDAHSILDVREVVEEGLRL